METQLLFIHTDPLTRPHEQRHTDTKIQSHMQKHHTAFHSHYLSNAALKETKVFMPFVMGVIIA